MMTRISIVIAASLIPILATTVSGQFPVDRRLTDTSGRSLDATVLGEAGDGIRIFRKSDGKEFEVPLTRLSAPDRKWLETLKNAAPPPPVTAKPKASPAPAARPPVPPLPQPPAIKPAEPAKPAESSFPPVAAPLPIDEILADQRKSGVVLPPDGWKALETTLRFKDGRTVPGFVYNANVDKLWYAAADMIQKSARLAELSPLSRVEIHKWRNQSAYAGSPCVNLIIDGKPVFASIIHSDQAKLLLLKEDGKFMENVPISKLDDASRVFLESWKAATWEPTNAVWAIQPAFAAVRPFSDDGHALVMRGGKWGVIDHLGKFVMNPRFDEVREIQDSLNIKVREKNKWGLLANGSQLVVPPEWEDVGDLHQEMVPVCRNGKWGYVRQGGGLAIPCAWDDAWRFSSAGLAVVTLNGKRGFIDRIGKVVMKPEWDGALMHSAEGIGAVRRGGAWALIDRNGKLLSDPIWEFRWDDRHFELGFIPAWLADRNEWGARKTLLGIDGKPGASPKLRRGVCLALPPGAGRANRFGRAMEEVIPMGENHRFDATDYGRRQVKMEAYSAPPGHPFAKVARENAQGLVDTWGKMILKPEWDDIRIHSKDMILIKRHGKWGLAGFNGKIRMEPTVDEICILNQQLVATKTGLNKPRVVNVVTGETSTVDFEYRTLDVLPNGCFGAKSGSGFKYYWPDGSEILKEGKGILVYVDHYGDDLIYLEGTRQAPKSWWRADSATRSVSKFENASRIYWNKSLADFGRIWIQDPESSKWHFCSIDGKRLGPVMERRPERWFMDDGLGLIRTGATCHFIGVDGRMVGDGRWDDARILRQGRAAVMRDGRWGFVDGKGALVVECLYEEVGDFFSASKKGDGKATVLAATCKGGKWGYIDPSGKVVIPQVGEVRGRLERGQIHFGTLERGWESAAIYNTDGSPATSISEASEMPDQPLADKWRAFRGEDGRMGIRGVAGKVLLDPTWRHISWVAPGVAAVRGRHGGGLFSPGEGWLYQDSDADRILRDEDGKFAPDFLQDGFVIIEQTPKWGYARWKKDGSPGLMAAYDFDGDPKDSSGGENHAVPHNVNWTGDKFGKPDSAAVLDGVSSFLECPVNVNPDTAPRLTMTAWVRSDGDTGNQFISHDDGGYDRALCNFNNRGKMAWRAFAGDGVTLGARPVNPGEWVFVAVGYDQQTQGVTLRVNNMVYSTKGKCSSGIPSVFIGKNPMKGEFFKGAVDNVRIFNRLISQTEMDALYREFLGNTTGSDPVQCPPVLYPDVKSYRIEMERALAPGQQAIRTKLFLYLGGLDFILSTAIAGLSEEEKCAKLRQRLLEDLPNLLTEEEYKRWVSVNQNLNPPATGGLMLSNQAPPRKNAPPPPEVRLETLTPVRSKTGHAKAKVGTNLEDLPLSVDGLIYQSGIFVHANSELVYDRKPEWKRFVAVAGIDYPVIRLKSSVRASVLAEDSSGNRTPLGVSPVLKRDGQTAFQFDVKIPDSCQKIVLIIDDGGDGNYADHADWVDAGFRR